MIEVIGNGDGTLLVCNEESKLMGMDGNRRLNGDVIAGPFFVVGTDGENFRSLTDAEVEPIQTALCGGRGHFPGGSAGAYGLYLFRMVKQKMEVTTMKIKAQIDRMVGENNRIKAYASVILGGEYVVRDIAVMDSKNGLFARMPYRSYKDRNGDMKYSDTVFAMNETSRNAINDAVLAAYEQRLHMEQDEAPDVEESIDESPGMVHSM